MALLRPALSVRRRYWHISIDYAIIPADKERSFGLRQIFSRQPWPTNAAFHGISGLWRTPSVFCLHPQSNFTIAGDDKTNKDVYETNTVWRTCTFHLLLQSLVILCLCCLDAIGKSSVSRNCNRRVCCIVVCSSSKSVGSGWRFFIPVPALAGTRQTRFGGYWEFKSLSKKKYEI